jgi:hypothetical protein
MSATLQPMTVEDFLAWEARQEGRYEFDGFPSGRDDRRHDRP